MTPDEQIAVIAAKRDGKPVERSYRAGPRYDQWVKMKDDEGFDFVTFDYRIALPAPRKPAELWMHKNTPVNPPSLSFANLVGKNNHWEEDGICFREVVPADKELDARARQIYYDKAVPRDHKTETIIRGTGFNAGWCAALAYRDSGNKLP